MSSAPSSNLERDLYRFLREGDEHLIDPEDWPERLDMDLGPGEHKYLAHVIAAWFCGRKTSEIPLTPRVYIAGALNAMACEYIQNLHRMIYWAEKLRRAGFSVYVPGLDFLMGLRAGDYTYADYFQNSQPWLIVSDLVFLVPGWENSSGTKREIRTANKYNIPIYEATELATAITEWISTDMRIASDENF